MAKFRDVELKTGLNVSTVSRALRGNSDLNIETCRLVMKKPVYMSFSGAVRRSEGLIIRVFRRILGERSDILIVDENKAKICISMRIESGIGREGFEITDGNGGCIEITGNDELGLLYGVGKFLRTSQYENRDFIPGTWRGVSVPEKEIRGVFLATHFYNYYHTAPIEEIKRYIEELALWGVNLLGFWFDMHHYQSIHDPEAITMIKRLHAIASYAKEIGLKVLMVTLSNEAYDNSPQELRADWTCGHDGYTSQPAGHFHVELCPNKPGGMEQLLKWREEVFIAFSDINLDYFSMAAYDQGGCTCSKCAPWGCNGYLYTFERMVKLAKTYFPDIKTILVTWFFDRFTTGEWEGLGNAFVERPDWVDYILADNVGGIYPAYVINNGVPGNIPLINFPEISMYGAIPWGGFGANPLPRYLHSLYKQSKDKISGGLSYSEGIYEDINKVIISQLYWDGSRDTLDIAREYVSYEYLTDMTEQILKIIQSLEKSYLRKEFITGYVDYCRADNANEMTISKFVIENCEDTNEVGKIAHEINEKLPIMVRNSWRWRILYLRCMIDYELANSMFEVNGTSEKAFQELTDIYHAENADFIVSPPTAEAITLLRAVPYGHYYENPQKTI